MPSCAVLTKPLGKAPKGNLLAKPLQRLVSKQKRRWREDGFDLDLSYITHNIIAMGLPCTGKSALYRNPLSEVVRFLNLRHGGQYKVYNLCTRAKDQYDPEHFEGRVACFPFEDHGVPCLEHVDVLARSVEAWLAGARSRVVCIHCLAGKGRTGLMVCAALLRMGLASSAREAMAVYGERRMRNGKGVTQPSQRRWCEYYEQVHAHGVPLRTPRTLTQVRVHRVPASFPGAEALGFSLRVYDGDGALLGDSGPLARTDAAGSFASSVDVSFDADVSLLLHDADGKPLAQLCLHASFLPTPTLATTYRWWDVERHHKGAQKLLKLITVELSFEGDFCATDGLNRDRSRGYAATAYAARMC